MMQNGICQILQNVSLKFEQQYRIFLKTIFSFHYICTIFRFQWQKILYILFLNISSGNHGNGKIVTSLALIERS